MPEGRERGGTATVLLSVTEREKGEGGRLGITWENF